MSQPVTELRVGIAVTTLNRRDMVTHQVAELRRLTTGPYDLVICDDGSSDGTPQALRDAGETVIAGPNRGVAWNKNRGIFYLMAVCGCDVAILLDDDMMPQEFGWERRWVEGAANFGHVNFVFANMGEGLDDRACTPSAPGLSTILVGQCMSLHRYAWSMVGYMDPRFRKYGHEHTEFTNRFLRNGFGGVIETIAGRVVNYYYVIGGGIYIQAAKTLGSPTDAHANALIWQNIESQEPHTFRAPWHDDLQRREFLAEQMLAQTQIKNSLPRQQAGFEFL
jgi:glycosyltransferase involved in cell wall biosynthesis